jgi:hypothetical protein
MCAYDKITKNRIRAILNTTPKIVRIFTPPVEVELDSLKYRKCIGCMDILSYQKAQKMLMKFLKPLFL